MNNPYKKPVRITITGAAGQIGYQLLFRIAAGEMLGSNQPVILQLLDLPQAQNALKGVVMELNDCAFPLLQKIIYTDNLETAFKDSDICLLVGARPRSAGMERSDLLAANGKIFIAQGEAIAKYAKENVKVLVVGNPANTNALIALSAAKKVGRTNPKNYHAMLRLDHNRAAFQLSQKISRPVGSIKNLIVWGNHSPTMYADYRFAETFGDKVSDLIGNAEEIHAWNENYFLNKVGQRGAEIIAARGLSSAASAANAAMNHIRDWVYGAEDFCTMGVFTDNSLPAMYGIPAGIVCGLPCICSGNGNFEIVKNLEIDEFSKQKIAISVQELLSEKQMISDML